MMLLRVLCRVSVSVGKCFFKINQQFLLCWLDKKWLNFSNVYPAAISAHGWDYRFDFTKKLINAMLQESRREIASCLKAIIVVSFVHEKIISWRKNARKFWDDAYRVCSRFKARSFEQTLTEISDFALY